MRASQGVFRNIPNLGCADDRNRNLRRRTTNSIIAAPPCALLTAPTSAPLRPCSRFLSLVRGSPPPGGSTRGSPRLPCSRVVGLDMASEPGEYRDRSPWCSTCCCLPGGQAGRHSPTDLFRAQYVKGRRHSLPLLLACFRASASTRPLPVTRVRPDTGLVANVYPGGTLTH